MNNTKQLSMNAIAIPLCSSVKLCDVDPIQILRNKLFTLHLFFDQILEYKGGLSCKRIFLDFAVFIFIGDFNACRAITKAYLYDDCTLEFFCEFFQVDFILVLILLQMSQSCCFYGFTNCFEIRLEKGASKSFTSVAEGFIMGVLEDNRSPY
jgi:hypothetical protein